MRCYLQTGFPAKPRSFDPGALLRQRGVDVVVFEPDTIDEIPLDPCSPVIGTVQVKLRLLERAGPMHRVLRDYPEVLHPFMERRHWEGKLADLERGPAARERPLFVKTPLTHRAAPDAVAATVVPSLRTVVESPIASGNTQILCSEAVSWIAEWRAYAFRGRIVDIFLYAPTLTRAEDATPGIMFDTAIVRDAVQLMSGLPDCPVAYALDFGVLASGQTTLIEANDALSLANYGLSDAVHLDLHMERWRQLMRREAPRAETTGY